MQYKHKYSQKHLHIQYVRMPVTMHNTIRLSVLIHLQLQAHISVLSSRLQNEQKLLPGFSRRTCVPWERESELIQEREYWRRQGSVTKAVCYDKPTVFTDFFLWLSSCWKKKNPSKNTLKKQNIILELLYVYTYSHIFIVLFLTLLLLALTFKINYLLL